MTYNSSENRYDYYAPLIGNGSIATNIGPDGTSACTAFSFEEEKSRRNCPTANIWWAGKRYIDVFTRDLIPFGHVEQSVVYNNEKIPFPKSWEQELDTENAVIHCSNKYNDNLQIDTTAFIHHDYNILSVEKVFYGHSFDYEFSYCLTESPHSSVTPRGMKLDITKEKAKTFFRYSIKGQEDYDGTVAVVCDKDIETVMGENSVTYKCSVTSGDKIRFYIILSDDKHVTSLQNVIPDFTSDSFYESHRRAWKKFYNEGYAKTGNSRIDSVYNTALYMLKCYTTKWSIPIGINDTHWAGRYFAFDEYFCFAGLLGGGHIELASRVPKFRSQGLEIAVGRASSRGKREARFPWESVETGEEASPPGFWYDHVFHMAHVAIGAWEYYEYTQDRAWLEAEGYDLIYSCTQFFTSHMIYETETGRTFIGKCSDLERLGSSVENAYMTTCSVIRTLQIMDRAANLLGKDTEYAEYCRKTADALFEYLPQKDGAFIPHPDCTQKSIAVFTGTFPYNVVDKNDTRQKNAIKQYLDEELVYGNMYSVGHGVSTWYACWKAMLFTRLNRADDTLASLKQAIESAGCFDECFEINEPDCIYRPWFTTAGGIFISSVNEMLLQSENGAIHLLPACPKELSAVSFSLAAVGGLTITVKIEDLKLKFLKIEKSALSHENQIKIDFPDYIDISLLDDKIKSGTIDLDKNITVFS